MCIHGKAIGVMKQLKVISFFTGAGGLDLGFKAAGAGVVFACDTLPSACETLRKNNPGLFVFGPPDFSGDIHDLTADKILDFSGLKKGKVDIMIGGPPCQPFSVAAAQRFLKTDKLFKRKGYACEERGNLIFTFVALALDLRPKAFLIENVPGILTIDGGESYSRIRKTFERHGYTMSQPLLLNSKDYGVPQSRQRVFLMGYLGNKICPRPEATHGEGQLFISKTYTTVAEALYHFSFNLPNSEIRNHNDSSLERYKRLHFGKRENLGRVDRLDPHAPGKTVIAGGSSGGGRSHLHPYQARTLSVRECARLQTFPDSYRFYGSIGRQFTQVGNAVPPLLAEVVARQLLSEYFGRDYERRPKFELAEIDLRKADQWLRNWSVKNGRHLLYDDVH